MEFIHKKLPKELMPRLYKMKMENIQPYSPLPTPAYLYFRANGKFIAIKGPLDFFTERDLKRLQQFRYVYFLRVYISMLPFKEAGERVREALKLSSDGTKATNQKLVESFTRMPASFELSNSVLKAIGFLWGKYPHEFGVGVDPFFVTIVINSLCDPIPAEKLLEAREKDVKKYERAILVSNWAVYLALVLGYCQLEFLNDLRIKIFENIFEDRTDTSYGYEIDHLAAIAGLSLREDDFEPISAEVFKENLEKTSQKLAHRVTRIKNEYMSRTSPPPPLYGRRAKVDA